jgi:hypothetical protein
MAETELSPLATATLVKPVGKVCALAVVPKFMIEKSKSRINSSPLIIPEVCVLFLIVDVFSYLIGNSC